MDINSLDLSVGVALGSEFFGAPQAYLCNPLVPGQANTLGLIDQELKKPDDISELPGASDGILNTFNKPGGLSGFIVKQTMAMNFGPVSNGTKWFGMRASKGLISTSPRSGIAGARRLAFYVMGEVGGNPICRLKIRGWRYGLPQEESLTLTGLTHEKQADWTSWSNSFDGKVGINDATNATPIVVTTEVPHHFATGWTILISGVLGNTAANGSRIITVTSPTQFSLNGSAGNGAYSPSATDFATYQPISPKPVASAFYNPNNAKMSLPIRDATNATPIVIRCGADAGPLSIDDAHYLTTGQTVTINNVIGNSAANGTRTITVVDSSRFSLDGSAGNGAYISFPGDYVDFGNLGYGGTGRTAAVWARLPLADGFKTRKAYDGIESIEKVGMDNGSTDTIVAPIWKTLDFGLRSKIRSIDDVLGGWVINHPYQFLLHDVVPWGNFTLQALAPIMAPIAQENLVYDPSENIVSFTTNHAAVWNNIANQHVYGPAFGTAATTEADLRGDMCLGTTDIPWMLFLQVRANGGQLG